MVLAVIVFIINYQGRSILLDQAQAQLVSIRSLSQSKIKLYLEKLKSDSLRRSREDAQGEKVFYLEPSLVSAWKMEGDKVKQLYGQPNMHRSNIISNPPFSFAHYDPYHIFLKTEFDHYTYYWLFNLEGISELLLQREGQGQTGEVYLVGGDHRLLMPPRHSQKWREIKVNNKSVAQSLAGKSGVGIVQDYRVVEVLSAYSNLQIDEVKFVLLSEVDLAEVFSPLTDDVFNTLWPLIILTIGINFVMLLLTYRNIQQRELKLASDINAVLHEREKMANESAIQIMQAQEKERENISSNLHDSIGQYLTVLKWGLTDLRRQTDQAGKEKFEFLTKTCDDIIHEIRLISHDLMPTLIKDFGCCLAIKDYFEKQKKIIPLKINLKNSLEFEEAKFRREFEINLYCMTQELFQNTLKHSSANSIDLELQIQDNELKLKYYDDGHGMSFDSPFPQSLNYRTKLFGGSMERLKLDRGLGFLVKFNLKEIGYEKS